MRELAHLVERVFTLRGYAPAPAGGHVLRFTRERQSVAVRVRETREPLGAGTAQEIADTLPALGHAVLVCMGDVGHEARLILERAGIDVWTRDKLIHEVGRAHLEAAEHGTLTPEPAAEDPSPALPPEAAAPLPPPAPEAPEPVAAAPPPAPPVEVPAPEPARAPPAPAAVPPAFARLWTRAAEPAPAPPAMPAPALPAPAPAAAPPVPAIALAPQLVQVAAAPAAPPLQAAATGAPGEPVLASSLDREGALRLGVGRLLKVDRATLELVPLHAFRYACRLETKGAPPVPKQGLLVVDAVSGAVRELPEPSFGAPAERGDRLQALVPDLDAANRAKRKVVEAHTQKLRVQSSLGRNSLIVEDRWVRPDPRSIQLEGQGVWWLPVWRLEGQNGMLRVNGATGAVEEEKLKRAFAADAEFL